MSKTVLIIDDAEITIRMLMEILTKYNYTVIGTAENGNVGFEQYQKLNPDLVMLDITMPECDGMKCIKLLKEYDKDVKILVCSALGQKKFVLNALKEGAANYLLKPFNEEKVIAMVQKTLNEI